MHLVRELGLEDNTDTLGRWLAHHVAELIAEAQNAKTAGSRREAGTRAVEVILKIWEHRDVLPGHSNPLARFREMLSVLDSSRDMFSNLKRQKGTRREVLAGDVYSRVSKLRRAIQLLDVTPAPDKTPFGDNAVLFLSDEERRLLKILDRWPDLLGLNSEASPEDIEQGSQPEAIAERLRKLTDETIVLLHELHDELAKTKEHPAETAGAEAATLAKSTHKQKSLSPVPKVTDKKPLAPRSRR